MLKKASCEGHLGKLQAVLQELLEWGHHINVAKSTLGNDGCDTAA